MDAHYKKCTHYKNGISVKFLAKKEMEYKTVFFTVFLGISHVFLSFDMAFSTKTNSSFLHVSK